MTNNKIIKTILEKEIPSVDIKADKINNEETYIKREYYENGDLESEIPYKDDRIVRRIK